MTLQLVEPALGRVNFGEQCKPSNGDFLKGPIMAFFKISTSKYLAMHAGCCTVIFDNSVGFEFW